MSERKQIQTSLTVTKELKELLDAAREKGITEEDLREQRISFAFGNAPPESDLITKDSVRAASMSIRLSNPKRQTSK